MIADLKRKSPLAGDDPNEHERIRREKALDDALKSTFPASDPVSVEQPAPRDQVVQRQGNSGADEPKKQNVAHVVSDDALPDADDR
jgi:hypothetical protein